MTSEASSRTTTAAQVMAIGIGAALAGVICAFRGYPGFGAMLLVVGAAIGWGGWRYRTDRR